MSSNNQGSKEVSVDEQAYENNDEAAVDEDGFEVVDERAEFRPTVEMEVQAKVDANHPDARVDDGPEHMVGKTLAQEERIQARNDELEHISTQAELTTQEGRPGRTRDVVTEQSRTQQEEFQERRAAVDHWADPERDDPREMLTQEQLGEVNSEAIRMDTKLEQWSRAAISRRLARAVVDGTSVMSAVLRVFEQLQTAPGRVVPIGELEGLSRQTVSIEGTVTKLWTPRSPAISQVGLIEDESGKTKFTSWTASNQPLVEEGERVRMHGVARNWYQGRLSVALRGWSTVHFPERGCWWDE
ncbi:single-stranded DNA-binding protein [Candidatus Halobonum tyrrellensis]|uniref:Single-stranded DNA-binding protein n=1 Tax=Candidatus Halobonum tyrrellensis G22 TaxID=1324957 RepID=V4HGC2_9EURY|nr:single-stranded DNA-binding protein [Candidatus Halobonum tyrrellensis]ESP86839.1 single-stranded DNA-binding protein [Candidatus Halobonum tyrrellensis G22]